MRDKKSTAFWIILLVGASALLYLIQLLLFKRPGETGFYFLQDLAFVPLNVLLVTLGVNTVLARRDRQTKLEKVSIVINEFFTEAGNELVLAFSPFLLDMGSLAVRLAPHMSWGDRDFLDRIDELAAHSPQTDPGRGNLDELHRILREKRDQILRLFENANLMENDRFTDMLWAVYHVYDELHSRPSCHDLPRSDLAHLGGDLRRAAQLLLVEWLEYMRLLRKRYPYLYSLAVRKCPFGSRDAIVRE